MGGAVRRVSRVVSACLVALCTLVACTAFDHYEARFDTINRSVGSSRDEMILLNIARARYSHPLTFMSVGSLSGTQGGGGNIGLPTITFGPAQTPSQSQFVFGNNSLAATANGNFVVSPLESREFYQGLLQPIGLNSVQFFLAQGYPRQILFLLLIDAVRIKSGSGERVLYNNPTDPTYPDFADYIHQLIAAGVTVEASASGAPGFCVDRGASAAGDRALGPVCGSGRAPAGQLTGFRDPATGRPGSLQITVRSTYRLFRYLGRLSDPEVGRFVQLQGSQVGSIVLGEDRRLFPVTEEFGPRCLTSVQYLGRFTCVPAEGAEQGAVVLQLLTQLVALNTSIRDLPAVPTIRLAN